MARQNAIERRLEQLAGLWEEFVADDAPRVLRWLGTRDEERVVDAFLELQNAEPLVPALFFQLTVPFEDATRYGFALVAALGDDYDASRPALVEQGIADDWRPPSVQPDDFDVAAFVRCCAALRAHYPDLMTHVVGVLTPEAVADEVLWQQWLLTLARHAGPEGVRFLVLDDASAPRLERLCETEPVRVRTQRLELDMPAALAELASAGDPADPAVQFRRRFVALTNAAAGPDLAAAEREARAALELAGAHGWTTMQFAVHMALGAARLAGAGPHDARTSYAAALEAAGTAHHGAEPAAPKLVVQATMADAGVLLSGGDHAAAAARYEEAAVFAADAHEPLLALEGWRMAAHCYEAIGSRQQAWNSGWQALFAAEQLEPEMRAGSTLPFAAQALLRLCERAGSPRMEREVRATMATLLGADWEAALPGVAATA